MVSVVGSEVYHEVLQRTAAPEDGVLRDNLGYREFGLSLKSLKLCGYLHCSGSAAMLRAALWGVFYFTMRVQRC